METIPAGQFKAHCLALLDQVAKKREALVVTKHGKPVVRILPIEEDEHHLSNNPLKNSIIFEGDLISPLDEEWDVLK